MRSIDSESDIQVVLKCDGENVVWKTPDELVSLFPLRGKGLPYKKRELSEDKNIATHPKNFLCTNSLFCVSHLHRSNREEFQLGFSLPKGTICSSSSQRDGAISTTCY